MNEARGSWEPERPILLSLSFDDATIVRHALSVALTSSPTTWDEGQRNAIYGAENRIAQAQDEITAGDRSEP